MPNAERKKNKIKKNYTIFLSLDHLFNTHKYDTIPVARLNTGIWIWYKQHPTVASAQ